jgi:hypothetical protein
VESVAHGPYDGPDSPIDDEVNNFPSARSPNDYAVTADGGTTLCNRSDARAFKFGRASVFHGVSVIGQDAAYANLSLSRIMISIAYLKRLIGCVYVTIQYRFSLC